MKHDEHDGTSSRKNMNHHENYPSDEEEIKIHEKGNTLTNACANVPCRVIVTLIVRGCAATPPKLQNLDND